MDFAFTDRCEEYRQRLLAFMDERIYPNERVYEEQIAASGNPHHQPAIMEELKARAHERGHLELVPARTSTASGARA